MKQPQKFKELVQWQRNSKGYKHSTFQDIYFLRGEAIKAIQTLREYKRVKKQVIEEKKEHDKMLAYFEYLEKQEKL